MSAADALQRTAADPAASVWVSASAGSGKTKVLSDRVLRLLLAGTPPHRILCLTFTKAAAAEMANRINRVLAQWATCPDGELEAALDRLLGAPADLDTMAAARRLFARVLDSDLNIATLHSFCQSVLARFPIEARVSPNFQVLDDRSARELLADAQAEVLARARADADGPLGAAVGHIATVIDEGRFAEVLRDLIGGRAELRARIARQGGLDGLIRRIAATLELDPDATEAGVVADACAEGAFDRPGLTAEAQRLLASRAKSDVKRGTVLAAWLAADPPGRIASFADYCGAFFDSKDRPQEKLATKPVLAEGPLPALAAEQRRIVALAARRRAAATLEATIALLRLGAAILETYEHHKRRLARLDYDDLILTVRDLFRRPGIAPWVLFKLDGGLDHILIDEAQDTSPEQWEVVRLLAEEFFAGAGARDSVRTVFAVGDVKQSIYSFQRADPQGFVDMRAFFRDRVRAAERPWHGVDLDISFRSTEAVLAAVDAVFAREEAAKGVGATRHQAHRADQGGRVEVWPVASPAPREARDPWTPPVTPADADSPADRVARHLADTIRGWLDQGARLEATGRPVTPGDILVLVRRRSAFVDGLVKALKQRNVPVAGVDRMRLVEQIAVMDLIALGRFLLLPEDDLTLATVLKGPLIGLDEDSLFALAHRRDRPLWSALTVRADQRPDWRGAQQRLAGWLAQADRQRPYELFARILDRDGGRRQLLGRLGAEAGDPIDEFLSLALAHEREGATSLQGFLHWLDLGQAEIKRDMEQGGDQVRIMTVHGAKGLQAPIVILPDTCQMPTKVADLVWTEDAVLWAPRVAMAADAVRQAREAGKEARDAELNRLLYVAMTRAADQLHVTGWDGHKKRPAGNWYDKIRAAIAPLAENPEAETLVLRRGTVHPPRTAEAQAAKDVPLPDWATRPAPVAPAPARPLMPSRPELAEPPVLSPRAADAAPARFVRGRLIHRLLQSLPDLPPEDRPAAARRFLAQPGHGLDPDLQAEMAAETLAVLDHPDAAPLFGPASRAEVPVAGLVGGRAIAGQIDRLAIAGDGIWLVDYKTNRPVPPTPEAVPPVYLAQMAAYRAVLRTVFADQPIHCRLLWTDGPRLMALADDLLDPHGPAR